MIQSQDLRPEISILPLGAIHARKSIPFAFIACVATMASFLHTYIHTLLHIYTTSNPRRSNPTLDASHARHHSIILLASIASTTPPPQIQSPRYCSTPPPSTSTIHHPPPTTKSTQLSTFHMHIINLSIILSSYLKTQPPSPNIPPPPFPAAPPTPLPGLHPLHHRRDPSVDLARLACIALLEIIRYPMLGEP